MAVAAAAIVAIGFAIYWFGPQYLFIDRRVDEAVPSSADGRQVDDARAGAQGSAATGPGGGPIVLSRGEFRSLEHGTSGRATLLELPDGSVFVRLEGLDTSNGPDLRVILSAAPASDDWYVYDDVAYVDLGPLKGNIGSSNYRIPGDLDLSSYRSVVVWCRRFTVGFGVASIEPAG
jgi:hypothetical protein